MENISLDDIIIREAEVIDVYAIADMWEMMAKELNSLHLYCDKKEKEKFIISCLSKILDKQKNNVFLVSKYKDKYVGFISGYIYRREYGNDKLIGFCENWYTCKPYRKTGISEKMVKELKRKGKELGVELFEFIVKYSDDLIKIYKRKNYTPSRMIFIEEL